MSFVMALWAWSVEDGLPPALVVQEGPEAVFDGHPEGMRLDAQPQQLQARTLQLGVVGPLGPRRRPWLLCQLVEERMGEEGWGRWERV